LSQAQLAERLKLPQRTYAAYEQGRIPPEEVLIQLAAMGLNLHWYLTGEGDMRHRTYTGHELAMLYSAAMNERPEGAIVRHVPVVSRIAAGVLIEQFVQEQPEETIPFDATELARYQGDTVFGLRIDGDSMLPWMWHGDVAICSAVRSVQVGDDVAVYRYATGKSTIKRLDAWNQKTHVIRLRPLNPEQDPFSLELRQGDQVKRVIGVYRDLSRRRSVST
jgi:SOS-response transcriptional repressor LexA